MYLQGMRRVQIMLIAWVAWTTMHAQSILHYTETSGFDHQTRMQSLAMFQDIAAQHGLTVVDDQDGSNFDDLAVLQQFAVVVFSNTSGDAILDPQQRANFEAYVNGGGSYLGIHAASDTYRHSTANGGNTGSWDFYAELVGASVQQNPNHVSGTPVYAMQHLAPHASTASLPDPWVKAEEYYYWENGYYRPDNIAVLEVEETVGPNNQVNSYDAPRPMSWHRTHPQGGRIFYTALGHAVSNYTSDTLFRAHIQDALLWCVAVPTGWTEVAQESLRVAVIASDRLRLQAPPANYRLEVYGATGRLCLRRSVDLSAGIADVPLQDMARGVFIARLTGPGRRLSATFVR